MERDVAKTARPAGPLLKGATLVLLTAIWGTTWAAIRVGLEGIPPFTGVAMRFTIASLLLLGLATTMGLPLLPKAEERWLWLLHGGLSFCVSYSVTYWAEQWVPSGLAAVLFATFPLFVAVLAHRWLPGERLNPGTTTGVVGGFLGVAVIFSEDFAVLGGPEVAVAAAVMLLSPLAASIANVAVKRHGATTHPVTLNAGGMVITAVFTGGVAALFERHRELDLTAAAVGSVFYLAVFGSAVAFVLYFWLLKQMPASQLALIALVIPVVAVAVGAFAFSEPVTTRTIVGTALVIAGVGLASLSR